MSDDDELSERIAIMIYDAHMSEADAERMARIVVNTTARDMDLVDDILAGTWRKNK